MSLNQKPPSGVSNSDFEKLQTAAIVALQSHNRMPTVQEIAEHIPWTNKRIASLISTPEFKAAMRERGYNFTDKHYLTAEQVWTVSIITDPTNRKSLKDKLAQAGIQYWTYKAWLSEPVFSRYVKEIGEKLLVDHVHDVHTRVVERATNGDIQAMRLYYDLIGRTDSNTNRAVADLNATVRLLLEVLMRNITDTATLNRITKEIEQVTSGEGRSTIAQFQFDMRPDNTETIESEVVPASNTDESVSKPIGKDWLI